MLLGDSEVPSVLPVSIEGSRTIMGGFVLCRRIWISFILVYIQKLADNA